MARPGKLITRDDADARRASLGVRACAHSLAIDQGIIDTISQRQRLTDEEVHDVRVDLKRLRAMRQLIFFETRYERFKEADEKLKDAGKLLANRRDQAVLVTTLKKLAKRTDSEARAQNVLAILEQVKKENTKSQQQDETLHKRLKTLVLADDRNWQDLHAKLAQTDTLLAGLTRTHSYARSLGQRVMCNDTISLVHRWRKWCKYLYYQVEFVSYLHSGNADDVRKDLKRLGSVLGLRHDIANLQLVLDRLERAHAVVNKYGKQVQAMAQAWDSELKKEGEMLFNRVFKQSSVTFSQHILNPAA